MTEDVSGHPRRKREQCVIAHWQQAVHDHCGYAVGACQMSCRGYAEGVWVWFLSLWTEAK